ncbi:MAG: hypothetical protein WCA46_17795 [Actinocatenispora sp.]
MSHDESATAPSEGTARPDLSRRRLLAGAAGVGVAVVAGSAVVAQHVSSTAQPTEQGSTDGPVTVHVRDARTGTIALFQGERRVEVTDRQLAARLTSLARG